MMQPFVKPSFPCGASNNIEASRFDGFQRLWNCWTFHTFYQINIRKIQEPNYGIWALKAEFSQQMSLDSDGSSL